MLRFDEVSIAPRWKLDSGGDVVQAANEAQIGRRRQDVDINGAKALKRRLGLDEADKVAPVAEPVDVPADAPPVYHWTGVSHPPPRDADDEPLAETASLFRRLGLSFR
jgi:hypothetical protein